VNKLGGWDQLYVQTDLMHLHLPADHPKLPWTAIGAMLLLNLNYWGSNQIILQRALAAKSVRHAQVGLLASGVLKYVMALIIVVPSIALAGLLKDNPLRP
jgi:SSS family solute:Na+ symporter